MANLIKKAGYTKKTHLRWREWQQRATLTPRKPLGEVTNVGGRIPEMEELRAENEKLRAENEKLSELQIQQDYLVKKIDFIIDGNHELFKIPVEELDLDHGYNTEIGRYISILVDTVTKFDDDFQERSDLEYEIKRLGHAFHANLRVGSYAADDDWHMGVITAKSPAAVAPAAAPQIRAPRRARHALFA
eukprot:COSAG06_NODE_7542_length_2464_cov_2.090063_2_plen_189_part_00